MGIKCFFLNLDEVDCMSIYGHHKKHGYGYNEQVGGPGDTEPKSPGNVFFTKINVPNYYPHLN
jgi:hypothetical protein